ncbi:MAG: type III pantothenate kinase [Prevotellaceae bacterium]|jgi:type III pantothenate kinase|nr:type III pantothenate kinase [Prevotellaceae bacterium]
MNLIIDQGNTCTKAAIFSADKLLHLQRFEGEPAETDIIALRENFPFQNAILSSVTHGRKIKETLQKYAENFVELSPQTPVPLENLYRTPETLGQDRLAVAVGANSLFPNRNLLIIDSGTAITYDVVNDRNQYLGGNIAPGMDMRFRALHEFTHKLPLVNYRENKYLLGNDTETAILQGVVAGIGFEMKGYMTKLRKKYPELLTFLTGGNAFCFKEQLKNNIFVSENLLLTGLNKILLYNV